VVRLANLARPAAPVSTPQRAIRPARSMSSTVCQQGIIEVLYYRMNQLLALVTPVVMHRGDVDIRSAKRRAWQNKVAKEFNTTDILLEFCLLQGEIAEAFDAWRKGREGFGEELADVAIYLLGPAEMTGVDLQDEIVAKMAKNAACVYQRLPDGVLAKGSDDAG
jgi:NTP pyrophosphatase (non-canonical NTP hydrolase)